MNGQQQIEVDIAVKFDLKQSSAPRSRPAMRCISTGAERLGRTLHTRDDLIDRVHSRLRSESSRSLTDHRLELAV